MRATHDPQGVEVRRIHVIPHPAVPRRRRWCLVGTKRWPRSRSFALRSRFSSMREFEAAGEPCARYGELVRAAMKGADEVHWWVVGGIALTLWVGRPWREHDDIDIAMVDDRASRAFRAKRRPEADVLPVEFVPSAATAKCWVSRRDPTLRVPWSKAVLSAVEVPVLAPELVLLGKSHGARTIDDEDATEVVPLLSPDARRFLAEHLSPTHRWQNLLV
jgi:hypothetical protein